MNSGATITAQVAKMRPKRYTLSQAAELVGKSPDTLLRWRQKGIYVPSDQRDFGQVTVYLYTSDDIRAMKKLRLKPGRKPKGFQ